jgi:hypothetical protein
MRSIKFDKRYKRKKRNERYKRYIDGNNSIYETKSRVFITEAEVEA